MKFNVTKYVKRFSTMNASLWRWFIWTIFFLVEIESNQNDSTCFVPGKCERSFHLDQKVHLTNLFLLENILEKIFL